MPKNFWQNREAWSRSLESLWNQEVKLRIRRVKSNTRRSQLNGFWSTQSIRWTRKWRRIWCSEGGKTFRIRGREKGSWSTRERIRRASKSIWKQVIKRCRIIHSIWSSIQLYLHVGKPKRWQLKARCLNVWVVRCRTWIYLWSNKLIGHFPRHADWHDGWIQLELGN